MIEQVEQHICIKFCIKPGHSSVETIGWFRRLQLWAAGDWQLHHYKHLLIHHVTQSFLAKYQITQVAQPPYSPDLVPCDFWLFPKLKSPLEGKRFQTVSEIQENTTGQLMATERIVWSQCAYFEEDWGVIVLCTMFLVSYIFFNKCLCFSYYMAGYLLDRPHIYILTIYIKFWMKNAPYLKNHVLLSINIYV